MPLTFFLAQLFGIICVVVGLFVLARKKEFVEIIHDVEHHRPLIFALGLISVVLGSIVVLLHNYWFGGLLPFVITLIGWVMLIRGLLAIYLPQRTILEFLRWARVEKLSWLYGLIILAIGLFLIYEGFFVLVLMVPGMGA